MNFASEFWDGFPMLCDHTDKGLNNFKDVAAFFKKVSEIESEYGKALKKVAKDAASKGRFSSKIIMENETGTMRTAWDTIVDQLDIISDAHSTHADLVLSDVVRPITEFVKIKENERKNMVADGIKAGKQYEADLQQHEKVRKHYESLAQASDAADHAYERDRSSTKTKEDKLRRSQQHAEKAQQAKEQAEAEYRDSVVLINEQQLQFFTNDLPHLLKQFEEFEASRIRTLQAFSRTFVQITSQLGPTYTESTAAMEANTEAIDVSADLLQFVQENRTDSTPPGEILFVQHGNEDGQSVIKKSYPDHRKSVLLSANLTGVKLGTGHSTSAGIVITEDELPNDVKIERCQNKIIKKRKAIAAEQKTISGMESLLQMYANNPEEADKVNKEIADINVKISGMEADLNAAIELLMALGGEMPPEPEPEPEPGSSSSSAAASPGWEPQYDEQGGYYDEQGGYVDAQGNYYEPGSFDTGYDQGAYDQQYDQTAEQPYDEAPAAADVPRVQALYAYEAQDPAEVSMNEGDVFDLVSEDDGNGWATIVRQDGASTGYVPANYVQRI